MEDWFEATGGREDPCELPVDEDVDGDNDVVAATTESEAEGTGQNKTAAEVLVETTKRPVTICQGVSVVDFLMDFFYIVKAAEAIFRRPIPERRSASASRSRHRRGGNIGWSAGKFENCGRINSRAPVFPPTCARPKNQLLD